MSPLPTFPKTGTLADWARLFTSVDVWRPAVEEICLRHGLGPADDIATGYPGSNAVFMVGGRLVVKIAWPFGRTGFYREVEILGRLEPYRATLRTPHLLAQGILESEPSWPYCVMEHVRGVRLGDVWPEISQAERLALAEELGQWVRALHAVALTPPLETIDASRPAWEQWLAERTSACGAELAARGGLSLHLLEQLPGYLERALPLYPADLSPVLLNGDVTEDHVLLARDDGSWHICSYIDFDDALAGHAEWEFTTIHLGIFGCENELMRAFLQAYGWDGWQAERFSQRMMAYSLLHPWFDFSVWIEKLGGAERVASLEQLAAALWGTWH